MKKIIIPILLVAPLILTGCESSEEKEAKEACKESLKEVYKSLKDDTITSCIADYSKDKKKVIYKFCVNTNEDIYESTGKIEKGSQYYEVMRNAYIQIKDEVKGSNPDYYAFEFKSDELK